MAERPGDSRDLAWRLVRVSGQQVRARGADCGCGCAAVRRGALTELLCSFFRRLLCSFFRVCRSAPSRL